MKDKTKEVFFPLFALFVIFSDELFYSIMSILDISLESGMKARVAIVIAVIAYIMMFSDWVKKSLSSQNWKQFLALLFILLLYGITAFFYPRGYAFTNYWASLLVYGSLCVPSAYVGMRLARGGYENTILKYLPYYLIIVSLVVGYTIILSSMQGVMLGRSAEDVFNYQNASYYISFCCAYSVFYIFYRPNKSKTMWRRLVNLVVTALIFLCAVCCIIGGGRGAFVYLVTISAFLVYRILVRGKKQNSARYFFMLLGSTILIIYLAIHFNIFETVGARRVAATLTTDNIRDELRNRAFMSFEQSPVIGHGLGSVWWEVGYYSHNMFLDFLVETGLVGTIIITIIVVKILIRLFRSSKSSNFDMFMLLLFLGHFTQATFSGYWFSSFILFLIFGYIFGRRKRERIISVN